MRHCLLLSLLTAAGAAVGQPVITVRDDAGDPVILHRPAQRVISLAPHATEMLFAVGAGTAVIATVARSDWPPEARALPQVGDANALDLERIVMLEPDLVIAWPYTAPSHLAALRRRNVRVFMSDPKTIPGIAANMERLAALAGTSAVATARIAEVHAQHAALRSKYQSLPSLRVFYQVWHEPLYTIGGRHLITEAIRLCGGENVFASLRLPAPSVTVEAVVAARPEVIVGGDDDGRRPLWLDNWSRWKSIPAVRDGNLFAADGNLLHRPGPRFLEGVEALCRDFDQARTKRDALTPEGTPFRAGAAPLPAPVRTAPTAKGP